MKYREMLKRINDFDISLLVLCLISPFIFTVKTTILDFSLTKYLFLTFSVKAFLTIDLKSQLKIFFACFLFFLYLSAPLAWESQSFFFEWDSLKKTIKYIFYFLFILLFVSHGSSLSTQKQKSLFDCCIWCLGIIAFSILVLDLLFYLFSFSYGIDARWRSSSILTEPSYIGLSFLGSVTFLIAYVKRRQFDLRWVLLILSAGLISKSIISIVASALLLLLLITTKRIKINNGRKDLNYLFSGVFLLILAFSYMSWSRNSTVSTISPSTSVKRIGDNTSLIHKNSARDRILGSLDMAKVSLIDKANYLGIGAKAMNTFVDKNRVHSRKNTTDGIHNIYAHLIITFGILGVLISIWMNIRVYKKSILMFIIMNFICFATGSLENPFILFLLMLILFNQGGKTSHIKEFMYVQR